LPLLPLLARVVVALLPLLLPLRLLSGSRLGGLDVVAAAAGAAAAGVVVVLLLLLLVLPLLGR